MNTLTSARLTLRPFTEADGGFFRHLHGDPGLTAKMHRGALNGAEADELLGDYMRAFDEQGFGMRAVCWTETGEVVGECGLWHRESAGGYTLRYMLGRTWWGRGLTGEAARAVVGEAFSALGLKAIGAVAMDGNEHSVRVLKALGMIKVESDHRGIPGFGRYRLAADDFRPLAP